MFGCFTADMCYNLRKIWKNHVILLKNVSFVVITTKKSLKCGYYFWKLVLTTKL